MTNPKAINFDDDTELQEAMEAASAAIDTMPITLFGEKFTMQTVLNGFTLLETIDGDPVAIKSAMLDMIVEGDRERFGATLRNQQNLDAAVLAIIYRKMLEAVMDRPTKSASASSRGPKTRGTATKSKAV